MSAAARPVRGYDGVAVAVPVTVPYARTSTKGPHWWIGRALAALVAGAGIDKRDIDGLVVASYGIGPVDSVGLTEYFGLELRSLDVLPMGGASGVVAARRAARAVEAGDAEIVACIAGDTLGGGDFQDLVKNFSAFSADAVLPYGAGGPNEVFALITRHYMDRYGATREDFGRVAVSQRDNARDNPAALFRAPLSMAQYLAARPIAEPLHLFDCVMPCCGAEGFLVMTWDRARALGLKFVTIAAAMERHNATAADPVQDTGGWGDAARMYSEAGLGPRDMEFIQAYDDYPVIVMLQLEELGFCAKGEAPRFVRENVRPNARAHDDSWTLNTNGGQLSMGQAGAAGGFLGMVEGIRQITGQTLGGAASGAWTGLVSGYGTVNYDRGLCTSAAILVGGTGQ